MWIGRLRGAAASFTASFRESGAVRHLIQSSDRVYRGGACAFVVPWKERAPVRERGWGLQRAAGELRLLPTRARPLGGGSELLASPASCSAAITRFPVTVPFPRDFFLRSFGDQHRSGDSAPRSLEVDRAIARHLIRTDSSRLAFFSGQSLISCRPSWIPRAEERRQDEEPRVHHGSGFSR